MSNKISNLAHVDPRAEIADDVEIGPFCTIGPHVRLGAGCVLDSSVTIVGHTDIGSGNRFFPASVIGAEPQDLGYTGAPTRVEIGDRNIFREGVTVNRGAEKEDGVTRIGNDNMLMSNAHVAHNCHIFDKVILVNGVLLGGHVHVQDGAIISGNSAVHHFCTVGTLSFIGGCSRVTRDMPPFMLGSGNDDFRIRTVNVVGLRRAGIAEPTIKAIQRAHRLIFREHKDHAEAYDILQAELDAVFPLELSTFFTALENTRQGKSGRGRESIRDQPVSDQDAKRKAA